MTGMFWGQNLIFNTLNGLRIPIFWTKLHTLLTVVNTQVQSNIRIYFTKRNAGCQMNLNMSFWRQDSSVCVPNFTRMVKMSKSSHTMNTQTVKISWWDKRCELCIFGKIWEGLYCFCWNSLGIMNKSRWSQRMIKTKICGNYQERSTI